MFSTYSINNYAVNGGKIISNKKHFNFSKGVIYLYSDSIINMTNCNFLNNLANAGGG